MAQLRDTVVQGSLRVTDTIFSTNLNLSSLTASYAVVTDGSKNLISRAITNNTSVSAITASTNLITANTLAYWNGAYSGTSSRLTILGTISTGTWNATTIGVGYGGTGTQTAPTQGGIIFGSSVSAYGCTSAGTSGQLLQSAGTGTPTWITATDANTASTIVKRNANGNFTAGTITADLVGTADYAHSLWQRYSLTKGTNPSTTMWLSNWFNYQSGDGIEVTDRIGGGIESCIDANGTSRLCLRAYQHIADSSNHNTLEVRCASDGTQSIAIIGNVNIAPSAGNYCEGIRIHSYSSWSDITLCGNDNTGDSGTSANSWFLGNHNGNFYITRNGSTGSNADAQRSEFSSVNNQWRLRSYVQAHKAGIYKSGLHIYGPTYGNTAADMASGTAGLFSWNDGGPQITFDTNATPGGSQAGALIFTDHDTAATGASWHFVSNQSDWNVTSKRFHAKTSISIGTNLPVTTYAFNVSGLVGITNNSNTVVIGSQNAGFCHIYNSANIPFIFNRAVLVTGTQDLGDATWPWGNLILKSGGRVSGNGGALYLGNSNNASWVQTQDICSHSGTGDTYWSIRIAGTAHFTTAYGAVWNDYAEMRNVPEAQKNIHRIYDDKGEVERDYPYAGHCVYEIGDGTMELVNQRLAKGCKIISDTFGFCIGETKDCCTPIAVTGRVLVYPYEDIDNFKNHIGDCVCSGPNGTVSIMTDEEKIQHPECIVGTISEIPTYDIWYCGNKTTKPIDVNGRIWIYVK